MKYKLYTTKELHDLAQNRSNLDRVLRSLIDTFKDEISKLTIIDEDEAWQLFEKLRDVVCVEYKQVEVKVPVTKTIYNPDGSTYEKRIMQTKQVVEPRQIILSDSQQKWVNVAVEDIIEELKRDNQIKSFYKTNITPDKDLYEKSIKLITTELNDTDGNWNKLALFISNVKKCINKIPIVNAIVGGLFSAEQGTGKDHFALSLQEAITPKIESNRREIIPILPSFDYLFENYGGDYAKTIGMLYISEAAKLGSYKQELKSLVTSDNITVKRKYKEALNLKKLFQLFITSNHDISKYMGEEQQARRFQTIEHFASNYNIPKEEYVKIFRLAFDLCPLDYDIDIEETNRFEVNESQDDMIDTLAKYLGRKYRTSRTGWASRLNISKDTDKWYELQRLLNSSEHVKICTSGKVKYYTVVAGIESEKLNLDNFVEHEYKRFNRNLPKLTFEGFKEMLYDPDRFPNEPDDTP